MNPSWALFCAVLPLLVSCSGPDYFTLNESSFRVSPVLESLQCYNDYQSKVDCQWREDLSNKKNMTLELWNWNPYEKRDSPRRTTRCEPLDGPPGPHDDVKNLTLMRCRFNTSLFAIAINHTFFFKTLTATSCFSSHRSLILSQQLRVHPPVDLSVNISEKGDRLIQWSSPYPASSRLSHNLTYQLNYRIEGQDSWKSETLNETHLELWNEHLDLPVHQRGCWYEARVRAKVVTRGLWSEWSPLVTWKTPEAKDQTPSMQCVLDGEEKVTCSWEVMKEKAQFITYHVECQHKHQNTINSTPTQHTPGTTIDRDSRENKVQHFNHMAVQSVWRTDGQTGSSHSHQSPPSPSLPPAPACPRLPLLWRPPAPCSSKGQLLIADRAQVCPCRYGVIDSG